MNDAKNIVSETSPVEQKSFDFDAINQRVAMGAPQDLMAQFKSISYDFLGVTRFTTGFILMQLFGVLFALSLLLGFGLTFLFADTSETVTGVGAEYLDFVREIVLASNLQFIGVGVFAIILITASLLFKKNGKIKEYFALSKQGIYLYYKGHLDLVTWDKLEPIVRVYGKGKSSTVVYKYKLTMAEQIANAMSNLPINNQNGTRINIPIGRFNKTASFGRSVGSGTSYGTNAHRQSPKLLKLHGVEHSAEILEVSNYYLQN